MNGPLLSNISDHLSSLHTYLFHTNLDLILDDDCGRVPRHNYREARGEGWTIR